MNEETRQKKKKSATHCLQGGRGRRVRAPRRARSQRARQRVHDEGRSAVPARPRSSPPTSPSRAGTTKVAMGQARDARRGVRRAAAPSRGSARITFQAPPRARGDPAGPVPGLRLLRSDCPTQRPATTLTFKSVQTYSNGEVVRWIGLPDADRPAPQVKLLAAAAEGASGGAAQARPAGTTSGSLLYIALKEICLAGQLWCARQTNVIQPLCMEVHGGMLKHVSASALSITLAPSCVL